MALSVILVEADVTSPAGVAATLRFADRAIFPMSPTDATRPNGVWDERIIEAPTLRRQLFDDLETLSPGLGVGAMVLANADRGLDGYQGHVWGEIRVWRWIYGTPFSMARALMVGPASGTPAFEAFGNRPSRVRLTFFDYRIELEKPVQTVSYAGTNNGSTIFSEGPPDLKGTLKPLAWGNLLDAQIPGVLVNPEAQIYQVHEGAVAGDDFAISSMTVFDRGQTASLTFGGSAALTKAGFAALVPAPDTQYIYYPEGLTKFDASLVGAVTFSMFGDKSGGVYVETPGPVIARILAKGGVPAGRIGASVAALASARVVGVWAQGETSVRELVGWVARCAPAAVLPDRMGVWQAVMLTPPKPVADHVLDGDEIIAIEGDDAEAVGAGEFTVGWGKIWTTFRRDNLATELLVEPKASVLASEYRYAKTDDPAFKARYPSTWRRLSMDTALRNELPASALAADLKALFGLRPDGRPRRRWRVTIEMSDAVLDLALGKTVAIDAPEFGVVDRFILIGEEPARPRRDQIIWTLWG